MVFFVRILPFIKYLHHSGDVVSDNSLLLAAWGGAERAEEETSADGCGRTEEEVIVVQQEVDIVNMEVSAMKTS